VVWIVFLRPNGSVRASQKIGEGSGGFGGALDLFDSFGCSLAALGDLDGDSVNDLAVGAVGDDDGGTDQGAVWILFMNPDGTVKSHQKISETEGGFTGTLETQDYFGRSLSAPGDLDNDDVADLLVGASHDDTGGADQGALWVLFLNANGTVKSHKKICEGSGGFGGNLEPGDLFGAHVSVVGDANNDGVADFGVAAPMDDDGGANQGALWILFLE
jgi:hypothetical protein